MDNKCQGAAECVDILETLEVMSLNDTKGKVLISCIKVSYFLTNNQFMVVRIYTFRFFFGSVNARQFAYVNLEDTEMSDVCGIKTSRDLTPSKLLVEPNRKRLCAKSSNTKANLSGRFCKARQEKLSVGFE